MSLAADANLAEGLCLHEELEFGFIYVQTQQPTSQLQSKKETTNYCKQNKNIEYT
jgi:hypothetical protein